MDAIPSSRVSNHCECSHRYDSKAMKMTSRSIPGPVETNEPFSSILVAYVESDSIHFQNKEQKL